MKSLWGLIIPCWAQIVIWGEWFGVYGEDDGFICDEVDADEVMVCGGGVEGGVVDGDETVVGDLCLWESAWGELKEEDSSWLLCIWSGCVRGVVWFKWF